MKKAEGGFASRLFRTFVFAIVFIHSFAAHFDSVRCGCVVNVKAIINLPRFRPSDSGRRVPETQDNASRKMPFISFKRQDANNSLASNIFDSSRSFRIVSIQVPALVQTKDAVNLSCQVDLGSERLYSLTWWKDDKQFFQYSPGTTRKKVAYGVAGITVDMQRSSMELVVIRNVSLATSGQFKCELVAEAPSFEKDFKTKNMTVVDIPDRTPILTTAEGGYFSPGEILVANCTSPGAKPAPSIDWKVNDKPISPRYSTIISKELPFMGLYTRTSQLRLPLWESHFLDGRMVLTCSASVGDIYNQLSHVTIKWTAFRTVAPSQKFFGRASTLCESLFAPWIPLLILLIWGL